MGSIPAYGIGYHHCSTCAWLAILFQDILIRTKWLYILWGTRCKWRTKIQVYPIIHLTMILKLVCILKKYLNFFQIRYNGSIETLIAESNVRKNRTIGLLLRPRFVTWTQTHYTSAFLLLEKQDPLAHRMMLTFTGKQHIAMGFFILNILSYSLIPILIWYYDEKRSYLPKQCNT